MSTQRKLLSCRCLFEKGHHISVPSPDTSHKGLRSKRMQPSDPEAVEGLSKPDARRLGGPEFSFDLLPEARAIQVTVPPGPEVSVRLCHQWALECEELSHHVSAQKIVSGGHTVELSYEFLLPCLCIEVSYLQEDGVRRKKCPFQSWPEACECCSCDSCARTASLCLSLSHVCTRTHFTHVLEEVPRRRAGAFSGVSGGKSWVTMSADQPAHKSEC